jgi:hypothetical protein
MNEVRTIRLAADIRAVRPGRIKDHFTFLATQQIGCIRRYGAYN